MTSSLTAVAPLVSQPNRKTHHLMGTALLSLLLRALGPISAFLLTLLLARALGAAATGVFYLTTTFMSCCAIVAKLGFDSALQRFAGGAAQRGDWQTVLGVYHQARRITLVLSVLAAAILVALSTLLSAWLWENNYHDLLLLIALAVVPFVWLGIQAAMLKAIGHPALGGFIEVAALPLITIILVAISTLHTPLTILTVAACYLTAAVASALLGTWLLQCRLPANAESKPILYQRLFASCLPLTLVELLNYAILWSPFLVLGLLASNTDAGLYNVSQRLAAQLGLILLIFMSISAPRFAACHQAGDPNQLGSLATRNTRLMTLSSLPLAVVLLLGAEPILALFGSEFVQAKDMLEILVLGQLVNIVTGPVGYLLTMTGHERVLRNLLLFIITPITLCLILVLIPAYGALGAAWAVSLSMMLQNVVCCWLVKQRLGLPFLLLLAPAKKRREK